MRKVAAGLFSSIDGVVEAPNEWQPSFDEEMGAVLSRMDQQHTEVRRLQSGRKRLFPEDTVLTKFELVEGQPTSSGAMIATYRPIR